MPVVEVEGQHIFYRRHVASVAPDRMPLVLVHGAAGLLLNWSPQLRHLHGRTVYALDLPGHGRSTGRGLTTIAGYRSCVAAFVDALNLSQFVLAGHSMGGAIALDMALARPAGLAGLILIGTSATLPVADRLLDGLENSYAETATWLVDLLFGPDVDRRLKEEFLTYLLGLDSTLVLGDFRACNGFDVAERVEGIEVPTLVLCGATDKMTPPHVSKHLYEHLPNSALELVENAGHMVMLEQPTAVAAKVGTFMDAIDQVTFKPTRSLDG